MIVKRGIVTLFAAAFALRVGAATVNVTDFAELQSAVAGASDGDEIVLAAGTYAMTASLTFSVANVTMRGATGDRDDVVLDAGLGNRRLAVNATGVTLRDFTFARGMASNADGVAVNVAKAGATLENIRVIGCLVLRRRRRLHLRQQQCRRDNPELRRRRQRERHAGRQLRL